MNEVVFSANTSWYLYNFRMSTISTFRKKALKLFACLLLMIIHEKLIDELGCSGITLKWIIKAVTQLKMWHWFTGFFHFFLKVKPSVMLTLRVKITSMGLGQLILV